MTEPREYPNEQDTTREADLEPQVKPELIKDLDVPSDDTDAIVGGYSARTTDAPGRPV